MVDSGRRVQILYTARLQDGTVIDGSDLHEGHPLEFVIGAQQVIPGLDKTVEGMDAFECRTVTIPAEEAYGAYDDALCETVPFNEFPNAEKLSAGEFIMLSISGDKVRVKVDRIEDGLIYFDFNHEYAGHDLTFSIEVISVFGETGSAVENEKHAAGCACGCHKLKEQLQT